MRASGRRPASTSDALTDDGGRSSYCFKRGIPCEFSEETSPRPTHAQSLVHIPGQYDGLPKHSFVGYPIEMTEGSYALVHLGTLPPRPPSALTFHAVPALLTRPPPVAHYSTPKDLSPSPSLERALRTPPLLHGLLLLASYLWSWHNDNIGHIRQAFLQHRLEAMQYLNQQAQLAASDDTTISLISHLALAEVRLCTVSLSQGTHPLPCLLSCSPPRRGVDGYRLRGRRRDPLEGSGGACGLARPPAGEASLPPDT